MPIFFRHYLFFFSLAMTVFVFSQCAQDVLDTNSDHKLSFSEDTISFDTLFVKIGSTTYPDFVVYNPHKNKINISSIQLGMGDDSPYRLNIDGIPTTTSLKDVEIWGGDSLHIFVDLTIDPNADNLPFVVEDSIIFETNGNIQDVQLVAWGQNAHFFGPNTPNGAVIGSTGDTTWNNDLPYVIFDSAVVSSESTLTINEGVKVHMHNGSVLHVLGSLDIQGGVDTTQKVVFTGTRLEPWYDNYAGQWGAIWLRTGSINNRIDNAIIKNGLYGIRIDSLPASGSSPNLVITNTVISDMTQSGILAFTAVVSGTNLLIYDCSAHALQLEYGGVYAFNHCTFGNHGNNHKDPVVRMGNYFFPSDSTVDVKLLSGKFYSSIIHGSAEEEVFIDDYFVGLEGAEDQVSEFVDVFFSHCLLKSKERVLEKYKAYVDDTDLIDPSGQTGANLFVNGGFDYKLVANSPCIDKGIAQVDIDNPIVSRTIVDITGANRDAQPDMGCFEFFE